MALSYLLQLLSRVFPQIIQLSQDTSSDAIGVHSSSGSDRDLIEAIAEGGSIKSIVSANSQLFTKFSQENSMINISMLQDELQGFVSGTSDIQGAALVSPDGLALASVLPGGMDEERTAAMSASMLSLGERICRELVRGNVDRIVVEGEKGYGVLVGCGAEAVLLVLAGSGVKQGLLFLEIKRAVSRISPLLAL
ncbi:roadblock/LC7 domain-containing protein [Calothrix sp. 336/3]|uniref:roadblock/LC7 domain-containing protein n=1 Tax=Calothrix sp. 336/3 TaxID=1337936 RepID=UPI0004E3A8D4|nr:roadblock/LC7 domain-containing protein [Calothrix sp. 336/3]AKG22564.1 hypothetical protein IJ00_15970 [Calothrix sp. 336/3]